MSNILNNKICFVTGSTRGIGASIAQTFLEEGADVIVHGRLSKERKWITENIFCDRLHEVYFDISSEDAIRNNLLRIKKEFGRIDVLVNNAGVEYNELIGMISNEHMEEMFRVNVYGMIYMIQFVSRIMARNTNGGSIINIASLTGLHGNAGQLVYSATKGAVIALTKSAAKELAPHNIRVNAIAPGLTKTDMVNQVEISKLQGRIKNIALGRLAIPEDIAGACLFLASNYASYISGQILAVDGCTVM